VSVKFVAVKEALQQKNTRERKNTQKEVEGAKTKKSKFVRWMNKLNKACYNNLLVCVLLCVNNGVFTTVAVTTTRRRTKAKREQKDQTHKRSRVMW